MYIGEFGTLIKLNVPFIEAIYSRFNKLFCYSSFNTLIPVPKSNITFEKLTNQNKFKLWPLGQFYEYLQTIPKEEIKEQVHTVLDRLLHQTKYKCRRKLIKCTNLAIKELDHRLIIYEFINNPYFQINGKELVKSTCRLTNFNFISYFFKRSDMKSKASIYIFNVLSGLLKHSDVGLRIKHNSHQVSHDLKIIKADLNEILVSYKKIVKSKVQEYQKLKKELNSNKNNKKKEEEIQKKMADLIESSDESKEVIKLDWETLKVSIENKQMYVGSGTYQNHLKKLLNIINFSSQMCFLLVNLKLTGPMSEDQFKYLIKDFYDISVLNNDYQMNINYFYLLIVYLFKQINIINLSYDHLITINNIKTNEYSKIKNK